jgi:DNA-binding HxlR family transcriptional regulator
MNSLTEKGVEPTHKQCTMALAALEDTLYVIGGKWKLKIIIALRTHGGIRFNELQRTVQGISARVLSSELKELEMNGFIKRNISTGTPVVVEYELTGYSDTLDDLLQSMIAWGQRHRDKIRRESKEGAITTTINNKTSRI